MIGFGMPNFVAERFTSAYENCKEHIACEGCDLIGGKIVVVGDGQEQTSIRCENGISKGVVNDDG